MFALKPKKAPSAHYSSKLNQFLKILKSHTALTENFMDSLSQVARVLNAECASIYLYEKKTNMFLLRKWVGTEPTRYSISDKYEFMTTLKQRESIIYRHEFSTKTAHELRQPSLYYFGQTLSNLTCPVVDGINWLGVINFKINNIENNSEIPLVETMIEIYADVLKRWLITQDLFVENKRLSEVGHVKNQLLSNVTHELQTPLNGILGLTEGLVDSLSPESKQEVGAVIELVHKSGKELNQTVNNLLNLVQIEAKKDKFKREKVNLLSLIKEVALLYSDACAQKNISMVIPTSNEDIYVFVNPDQIRTVLMNLVGNAVKFTEKGKIGLDIKKSGEVLHVSVLDTGIGISDKDLSLIFEEFVQADGSHTRLYGGTGLGLAIAKKIINLHQGRIWAESQKGVGSCFTFTLPMYPV